MQKLTLNLIFIIPVLGLIAGLSLGITIPLFMMASLYLIKDNIQVTFTKFKLELVFFLWLFLSCIWSINAVTSFVSLLKTFSLALVTYVLVTHKELLLREIPIQKQRLGTTIIGSLILFYVEFASDGAISLWFRSSFQTKESHQFYLHYLDRGCTLLALFAWAVIAQLLRNHKNTAAILLYLIVTVTLALSDSLAALVGFIVAGSVFLLTKYTFFGNPKILSFILVGFALLFIAMATTLKPYKLSEDADFLPISAKHRLFIWNFAAQKAMQKPILGWGHASSRNFDITEADMVDYQGHHLHPLPMHPHNNLLQILLETGIIGLALYMALVCKYLFRWNDVFRRHNSKPDTSIKAAGYACFSTFFIISMISFNMWQSWWMCSFLWIAIIFSLISKSALEE